MPARLPGREARIAEPAHRSMAPLVSALVQAMLPWLDRPYVLFGHSLGSLIAYELAHRLHELGVRQPSCLLVSAYRSPERRPTRPPLHHLPPQQFLAELKGYGGIADAVFDHPELLALSLPTLQADFSLFETYVYPPRPALECPIVAFSGRRDHVVAPEDMAAWCDKTRAGFTMHQLDGGHFFITSHEAELLRLIGQAVRSGVSAASPSHC